MRSRCPRCTGCSPRRRSRNCSPSTGTCPARASSFIGTTTSYADFDDFLGRLASRKRKQIRKERRRAKDSIESLEMVPGRRLDAPMILQRSRSFLSRDLLPPRRSGLSCSPASSSNCSAALPHRLALCPSPTRRRDDRRRAVSADRPGAVRSLLGLLRAEVDCLHFETAYYAGIEHCIDHKDCRCSRRGRRGNTSCCAGSRHRRPTAPTGSATGGFGMPSVDFSAEERSALPSYMRELQKVPARTKSATMCSPKTSAEGASEPDEATCVTARSRGQPGVRSRADAPKRSSATKPLLWHCRSGGRRARVPPAVAFW